MQPYLFPYLGYFQLCRSADVFVLYDDAAYIKQGYINRNTILVNGGPFRFTIPVSNGSANSPIRDVTFRLGETRVMRTIAQAYARAPRFGDVFPMLESVLGPGRDQSVTTVCEHAIRRIMAYIGAPARIIRSSSIDYDRSVDATAKLIGMCRALGADEYVNSAGGRSLYDKDRFRADGIRLMFLEPRLSAYEQGREEFVPNLSIIDMLMRCDPGRVLASMDEYELS